MTCSVVTDRLHAERWQTNDTQKDCRQMTRRKVTNRWHAESWHTDDKRKEDTQISCSIYMYEYMYIVQYTVGDILMTCRKVTGRWHAERWHTYGMQKWNAVWWRTNYMQKGDILTTCRKPEKGDRRWDFKHYSGVYTVGDMQNRDRNTYKMGTH